MRLHTPYIFAAHAAARVVAMPCADGVYYAPDSSSFAADHVILKHADACYYQMLLSAVTPRYALMPTPYATRCIRARFAAETA